MSQINLIENEVPELKELAGLSAKKLRTLAVQYPLFLGTCCNHLASALDERALHNGEKGKQYWSYIEKAKTAYNKARECEDDQIRRVRVKMREEVSMG
jgi:hypothetical protein